MFDFRFESDFIKNMILQEKKRVRAPSADGDYSYGRKFCQERPKKRSFEKIYSKR